MYELTAGCAHQGHYGHIRGPSRAPIADVHHFGVTEANVMIAAANRTEEAEKRAKELEAEVETRRRESRDGAWYWRGDGEDFPESLTCPVIMSADTVRVLLRQGQVLADPD